jgi:hypothetical protein
MSCMHVALPLEFGYSEKEAMIGAGVPFGEMKHLLWRGCD